VLVRLRKKNRKTAEIQREREMADKIEKEFDRNEFADYLADLAEQIQGGRLASDRGAWTVPEKFEAKVRVKEKKGRLALKLNFHWSTLADYSSEDRKQVTQWHRSMKAVKKRMGSSFKEVVRAAGKGEFPAAEALDDFVATSRVFAESVDPEWGAAMDEYMDHLENFIRAVQDRQLEQMRHEIRDLQYRMKACHREFK
jgi:XXXCH domain-containing protein